jgi:Autographiviridae endonuclease VII
MNLIGCPPLTSIPSRLPTIKTLAAPELLSTIPPEILNSPSFPYNEDHTERWCYPCQAFKKITEFQARSGRTNQFNPKCKQCAKVPSEIKRRQNLKRNHHGFTSEEYDTLFAEQGGVCAVCKQPEQRILRGKPAPLSIDHCHTSQKIRALLCGDCNTSFGLLKEDPERIQALLAYAKQWQGVTFAKL